MASILDTTRHKAEFHVGDNFERTMGCRLKGLVVSPNELPYEIKLQIYRRGDFRKPVIPVKYSDNTFGYEHNVHIKKVS